ALAVASASPPAAAVTGRVQVPIQCVAGLLCPPGAGPLRGAWLPWAENQSCAGLAAPPRTGSPAIRGSAFPAGSVPRRRRPAALAVVCAPTFTPAATVPFELAVGCAVGRTDWLGARHPACAWSPRSRPR